MHVPDQAEISLCMSAILFSLPPRKDNPKHIITQWAKFLPPSVISQLECLPRDKAAPETKEPTSDPWINRKELCFPKSITVSVQLDIEKWNKKDLDIELNKLGNRSFLDIRKLQLHPPGDHSIASPRRLTLLPPPPFVPDCRGALRYVLDQRGQSV